MPDATSRTLWMFVCELNVHHFYVLSVCTPAELATIKERIGSSCPCCGAPINHLDVASVAGPIDALKIEPRPRGGVS